MHNEYKPRKPFIALLMSSVLPGFGQLYNGEMNKAIWLFLCFVFLTVPAMVLIALYLPSGWMMPTLVLSFMMTVIVWLYGMVDAWRSARVRQEYVTQTWQLSGVYMLVLVLCNMLAMPLLISHVRAHQVELLHVPSSSMEPSVLKGDAFFADKRYNCPGCKQGIQRGDIVIFANPNDRTLIYIKRIIGLPGDRVQISGRHISVNEKSLTVEESRTGNSIQVTEADGEKKWQVVWAAADDELIDFDFDFEVPPGEVFVLGDNRVASSDSRIFGTVSLQDVVGKARQIWFSSDENGVRWRRLGQMLE